MASRIPATRLLIAACVLILFAAMVVEAPDASLRILWRFAALSFDNPSTQAFDELTSESASLSIEIGARDFTRLIMSMSLAPAGEPQRLVSPALCSGITRSPPAV
jgi:hypothetical protein